MAEKDQAFDESDGGYVAPSGGYTPGGLYKPSPSDNDPKPPIKKPVKKPAGH